MNEARGQSMAKLIMSLDGSIIREIPLDKERVTIGRKPTNDVQIENLAVSGEHARVVTILNDSFLEDLGSTNGTLVNGAPVKKHILQSNDLIEIGKYKLKVRRHRQPRQRPRTWKKRWCCGPAQVWRARRPRLRLRRSHRPRPPRSPPPRQPRRSRRYR
jgi:hypothetical protein